MRTSKEELIQRGILLPGDPGLNPGLNLGSSASSHQVTITTQPSQVTQHFVDQINSRLLLLFTGKPRLAKNLLQNVIR